MESYFGYVDTAQDAFLIIEGCRRGKCSFVMRRLSEKERMSIRSGSVYVFNERESGIRRWTDGMFWSPSRILGNFLVYRQLERRIGSGSGGGTKSSKSSSSSLNNSNNNNNVPMNNNGVNNDSSSTTGYFEEIPPGTSSNELEENAASSKTISHNLLAAAAAANLVKEESKSLPAPAAPKPADSDKVADDAATSNNETKINNLTAKVTLPNGKTFDIKIPEDWYSTMVSHPEKAAAKLLSTPPMTSSAGSGVESATNQQRLNMFKSKTPPPRLNTLSVPPSSIGSLSSTATSASTTTTVTSSSTSSYPLLTNNYLSNDPLPSGNDSSGLLVKPDGLVKKTISLTIDGVVYHLVSYFTRTDVLSSKLITPSRNNFFSDISIPNDWIKSQNFRTTTTSSSSASTGSSSLVAAGSYSRPATVASASGGSSSSGLSAGSLVINLNNNNNNSSNNNASNYNASSYNAHSHHHNHHSLPPIPSSTISDRSTHSNNNLNSNGLNRNFLSPLSHTPLSSTSSTSASVLSSDSNEHRARAHRLAQVLQTMIKKTGGDGKDTTHHHQLPIPSSSSSTSSSAYQQSHPSSLPILAHPSIASNAKPNVNSNHFYQNYSNSNGNSHLDSSSSSVPVNSNSNNSSILPPVIVPNSSSSLSGSNLPYNIHHSSSLINNQISDVLNNKQTALGVGSNSPPQTLVNGVANTNINASSSSESESSSSPTDSILIVPKNNGGDNAVKRKRLVSNASAEENHINHNQAVQIQIQLEQDLGKLQRPSEVPIEDGKRMRVSASTSGDTTPPEEEAILFQHFVSTLSNGRS